jgi:ribose 5-phosphate isomerase A
LLAIFSIALLPRGIILSYPQVAAQPMSLEASVDQLEKEKQAAARTALSWVQSGMKLGLGTGTTARYFIQLLGEHVRQEKWDIEAVASSIASEAQARDEGIRVISPRRGLRLDLGVDGADEIDPNLNLMKGRGGALLREKVLAQACHRFVVIADSSKRVGRLGGHPLPVEVVPFAAPWVADSLEALGGKSVLKMSANAPLEPYLTDQANYILECTFSEIADPQKLGEQIEEIPGVVGHGLFVGYTRAAIVAEGNDVWVLRKSEAPEKFNASLGQNL